jgi:hypothetical protein
METFGITPQLRRSAERVAAGGPAALKNSYTVLNEGSAYSVDPHTVEMLGFGFDYYMEIFRVLEASYDISGLDFFISIRCPTELPKYGPSVVLLVLGDMQYLLRPYFYRIRCVFKCMTIRPQLVVTSWDAEQLLSIVIQYVIKSISHSRSWLVSRLSTLGSGQGKLLVYAVPYGYFFNPGAVPEGIVGRDVGFSFAGSVEYFVKKGFDPRRLLTPPKLISRRTMIDALERYLKKHPNSGVVRKTEHFMESITNRNEYLDLLKRSKIVLCPRGEVSETFRFFEAAAAGCAIVCERLPSTWYYENNPAVILNDWRKLDAVLDELLANEMRLAELARQSFEYWRERVSEVATAKYIVDRLSAS